MNKRTKWNWFCLFNSNFVSLFNDNYLKNIIVFLGVTWALPDFCTKSLLLTLVSGSLVLPYLLLTPISGILSKKYSKVLIYKYCKIAEIFIMLFATFGILIKSVVIAIVSVLLMGVQSCLNSPSKYGIIKDIEGEKKLEFGNGMIEMAAFLGILLGTVVASFASDYFHVTIICSLFMLFALAGFISVKNIRITEPPCESNVKDTKNPFKFLKESYLYAKQYMGINTAILGDSIFWMIAGMVQMNLVIHGTLTLGESNTVTGILMSCAAVGIAIGCMIAGKITTLKNQKMMIMLGLSSVIVTLFYIVIFNPVAWVFGIIIFIFAFSCGIFEIPCLTLVQRAPMGRKVGDMIAYLNLVNFIFVLIGTGIFYLITAITGEDSLAVFRVIMMIALVTWIFFAVEKKCGSVRWSFGAKKSVSTEK